MLSKDSWLHNKDLLTAVAKNIDKTIKLRTTKHKTNRFFNKVLHLVTFKKLSMDYLEKTFARCVGNYHFYPEHWTYDTVLATLHHEGRHTKQYKFFGFGIHPLIGVPLFLLTYIFLPIPIFFALGRFFIEWDADRTQFKALKTLNYSDEHILKEANHSAEELSRMSHLFALPKFLTKKLYLKMANKVIREFNAT